MTWRCPVLRSESTEAGDALEATEQISMSCWHSDMTQLDGHSVCQGWACRFVVLLFTWKLVFSSEAPASTSNRHTACCFSEAALCNAVSPLCAHTHTHTQMSDQSDKLWECTKCGCTLQVKITGTLTTLTKTQKEANQTADEGLGAISQP